MSDTMTVTICDPALENPHDGRREVHYRLYLNRYGRPVVICVQDFDYFDYKDENFLSTDAWDDEREAERALNALLVDAMPRAQDDRMISSALKSTGMALTRQQAVYAFLQDRMHSSHDLPTNRSEFAVLLREHAFEQDDRRVREHLKRMADVIDGGVGPAVHHGCPDSSVPTAECGECATVLGIEVSGGVRKTMFSQLGVYDH